MEVAGALVLAGVLVPSTVGVVLLVVGWAAGLDPPTGWTTGMTMLTAIGVFAVTTS